MENKNNSIINSTDCYIKSCYKIGDNYWVVLNKKAVQKLQISENTLLKQELTDDGIIMRIHKNDEIKQEN